MNFLSKITDVLACLAIIVVAVFILFGIGIGLFSNNTELECYQPTIIDGKAECAVYVNTKVVK